MTTPGAGRSSIGVRVRPNADNFIKELKAQLASKRATYYVDVQANMGPANKTVAAWAKGELKSFNPEIPVGANTTPATRDLNKWKNQQREIKTNIPIGVDMTPAQRELTAWRQAAKRDLEIPVKLNVRDLDAALARASKRRVKAEVEIDGDTKPLEKKITGLFLPGGGFKEVKIDADTREAETKVKKVKAEAEKPAKSRLELDVEEAQNKLRRLRIQEAAKKLGVKVDIDADPKKAELQLKLLRANAAARDLEMNVNIKRGSLERVFDNLRSVEKRVGSLTVLRSLDLGPITLGKPTGLIGTLATLTTLAGLVPTIVTTIGALADGFMRLAGAAALVPGAIGGIIASLGTFALATSGVGDTIGAMFDMWTEGASAQASAAKRSLQAQNQYRNAVVDESRAQENLADARRQALNELRSLNNELRHGVLNEAQAILDAQKARDRYAKGLMEGFDSETDRQQALLDIASADQSILDVREKNIDLQQRANKANEQQVEGSDKVRDALEGVVRAQQASAQALEAMASTQALGAVGKFNDLLAQLSPNAQEFVQVLLGMKGELQGFRNELQDTLFQGLAPALDGMFKDLLPVVKPGMLEIANAIGDNLEQVMNVIRGPDGRSIIERILGGTAEAQRAMSGLVEPLIRGFGTLMAAGAEHLPQFVDLMTQLADRFATFIEKADDSGALDKFLDDGIKAMGDLAETGLNLLDIIGDFQDAFQKGFGKDIFEMIRDVTAEWHQFLSSDEGQDKLLNFINEAKDLWAEWKPVLKELPGVFDAVAEGAKAVLDIVLPFLKEFAKFAKEHPALVEAFIGAWFGAKVLVGVLSPVLAVLSGILKTARLIPGVANALSKIPGVGPALSGKPPGTPGGPGGPKVSSGTGGGSKPQAPVRGGPGDVSTGGALPGGPRGPGAAPGTTTGTVTNFAANAAEHLSKALGPLGLIVGGALAIKGEVDAGKAYDAYAAERATIQDPAVQREYDKQFLKALNIDIPDSGPYPQISRDSYQSLLSFRGLTGQGFPHYSVKDGKFVDDQGVPLFAKGGFTNWPMQQGKMAMLHGKEYIQPADTTAHYGIEAMEAIHEKRVPRELIAAYAKGRKGYRGTAMGYQTGGYFDENGNWIPEEKPLNASQPNPMAGPGIIDSVASTAAAGITHGLSVGSQIAANAQMPLGPAPGPVDAAGNPTYGVDTSGGQYTPDSSSGPSINLFGIKIPLGPGGPQPVNNGWGEGGPPPGLGGVGDDGKPFDIRKFGIGPGPVGSGPADWAQFAGSTLGQFGSGLVTAFASGVLDFFGLSGIMSNVQSAGGLISHFANPDQGSGSTGSTQANDDVAALLQTLTSMPTNPDYPGVPNLPDVFDPTTGSALGPNGRGLQRNTARGEAIIKKYFPWATNIGGVRPDPLKWHPSGLALDVMIPGASSDLNAPTPPAGKAQGDQLYAWLNQHKDELGIDYILWQEKDHYNHLHVNFAPSGYEPGDGPGAFVAPPGQPVIKGVKKPAPPAPGGSEAGPPPPKPPKGTIFGPAASGFHHYKGGLVRSYQTGGFAAANPNWEQFDITPWGVIARDARSPGSIEVVGGADGPGTYRIPDSAREGARPGHGRFGDYEGIPGWTTRSPRLMPEQTEPYPVLPGTAINPGRKGWWNKTMDRGGWLMPGTTVVHNYTGKPEAVVPSYALGGYNPISLPIPPPKPPILPRPPEARMITPPPPPKPAIPQPAMPVAPPPPEAVVPQPMPPIVPPSAPPAPPGGQPPGAPAPGGAQRPSNAVVYGPAPVQPPEIGGGMHVHPALQKGIASTASVVGNIAAAAIDAGMAAATFGGSAVAGGGLGGGGGGGLGSFVAGLIQQGGKIATNIANVGSSFLVGNITGGTTANAYGVTQRGSNINGGTKVIDASNNQYGDVYTNNLDEYFARMKRREDQKAQATLGHWGR